MSEQFQPKPADAEFETPEACPEESLPIHEPVLFPVETQESIFGGTVEITMAAAIDSETDMPVTDIPVYFAGGMINVKNEPYLTYLARHGRNALAVSYDGPRERNRTFETIWQTESGKVGSAHGMRRARKNVTAARADQADVIASRYQMEKASSLLATFEDKEIERVDAILQSGALSGMLAAYSDPDRFRNIVFAYAAGISGPDRPGEITANVARDARYKRRWPTDSENSFKDDYGDDPEATRQHTKRPRISEAMLDGVGVAYSDHAPLLHGLRQYENAPGVAIVAGLEDPMYSPERFLETLHSPDDVDYILVTEGPHGIGYRRDVMGQVMDLFPAMEARKAGRHAAAASGQPARREPLRNRLLLPVNISQQRAEQLYALADEVDRRYDEAAA